MEEKFNVVSLTEASQINYGQQNASQLSNATYGQNAISNSILYPYYPYYPYYGYPTTNYKDIVIRKVENGWIIVKYGKEYICTNEKDLAKLITKEEK